MVEQGLTGTGTKKKIKVKLMTQRRRRARQSLFFRDKKLKDDGGGDEG